MRKTFFLFFLLLFSSVLLLFPQKSFAVFSFNISSPSATTLTSGGQEITVYLNITSLPSESYFRVALQKPSGGSYIGQIQNNNGDWAIIQSLSGDCTNYYKVTDTNTSSLTLKYKLGDDASPDNTTYLLKGHRFTKTCSSYTEASNSLDIALNLPTPTPTPTSNPTSTNTLAPTVTPTPAKTPTPTPKTTVSPAPKDEDISTSQTLTFGNTPTPESSRTEVLGQSDKNAGIYFILSGAMLFVAGIYIFIKKNKFNLKDKIGI